MFGVLLEDVCIITMLQFVLFSRGMTPVPFGRMGDYYRYLAEHIEPDKLQSQARALASYYVASAVAKVHLKPTDPVRLGLALNNSVFYYEVSIVVS